MESQQHVCSSALHTLSLRPPVDNASGECSASRIFVLRQARNAYRSYLPISMNVFPGHKRHMNDALPWLRVSFCPSPLSSIMISPSVSMFMAGGQQGARSCTLLNSLTGFTWSCLHYFSLRVTLFNLHLAHVILNVAYAAYKVSPSLSEHKSNSLTLTGWESLF